MSYDDFLRGKPRRNNLVTAIVFAIMFMALLSTCVRQSPAASVELLWDRNTEPDLSGYRVTWSNYSGNINDMRAVGTMTTVSPPVTIPMSTTDKWFFRVQAFTPTQTSLFSNHVYVNFIRTPSSLKLQRIDLR